jgi:hypothetical protein
LILLFASKPISAQWFVEAGAGYMLPRNLGYNPVYSDLTLYYNTINGETTNVIEEKIHFSALHSFTWALGGGYAWNNFEFGMGVMYASNLTNQNLSNNQFEAHYIGQNSYSDKNFIHDEYMEVYQRSLIIQPGIKYNFKLGRVLISPFADFSFHFMQLHQHNTNFFEEENYPERKGGIYREFVNQPKTTFGDLFNPDAGLQFEFRISPDFSVWMNASVSILDKEMVYTDRDLTSEEISGDGKEFERLVYFSEQTPFTANLSNIKTTIGFRYYVNNTKN